MTIETFNSVSQHFFENATEDDLVGKINKLPIEERNLLITFILNDNTYTKTAKELSVKTIKFL